MRDVNARNVVNAALEALSLAGGKANAKLRQVRIAALRDLQVRQHNKIHIGREQRMSHEVMRADEIQHQLKIYKVVVAVEHLQIFFSQPNQRPCDCFCETSSIEGI